MVGFCTSAELVPNRGFVATMNSVLHVPCEIHPGPSMLGRQESKGVD